MSKWRIAFRDGGKWSRAQRDSETIHARVEVVLERGKHLCTHARARTRGVGAPPLYWAGGLIPHAAMHVGY